MKKKFNIFVIFIFFFPLSINTRTWWDTHNSFSYNYNDPIDFAALRKIIKQEIDRLLQPHAQTLANRNHIDKVKKYAKKEIGIIIKKCCSTHAQALEIVIKLTEEFSIDIVVEWAARTARNLLKNPPVNPYYLNKQKIIASVKHITRGQALLSLLKDHTLTKIVQNLTKNVEMFIDLSLAWH